MSVAFWWSWSVMLWFSDPNCCVLFKVNLSHPSFFVSFPSSWSMMCWQRVRDHNVAHSLAWVEVRSRRCLTEIHMKIDIQQLMENSSVVWLPTRNLAPQLLTLLLRVSILQLAGQQWRNRKPSRNKNTCCQGKWVQTAWVLIIFVFAAFV